MISLNHLRQHFKGRFHRYRVLRALATGVIVGGGMALFVPLIGAHSEVLISVGAGIAITLLMLFLD